MSDNYIHRADSPQPLLDLVESINTKCYDGLNISDEELFRF